MKNTFSSDSTNPRVRRAYAHAKRDVALRTGDPQDKIEALDAATKAMNTGKGRDIGKQVLSSLRNAASVELIEEPRSFSTTHKHGEFTTEDIARVMQNVSAIDGEGLGVSVTTSKPETVGEYEDAFHDIEAMRVERRSSILEGDGSLANKQRSEAVIQSGIQHHHDVGNHLVIVEAQNSTSNFYNTVRSVTKPYAPRAN